MESPGGSTVTDEPLHWHSALRGWLAVLAVSLGTFSFVTTEMLPVGVLTNIGMGVGVSVGMAGLVMTVYGVAAGLGAPPLVAWTGRLDRRLLLVLLLIVLILGNFVTAWAPNFAVLMIARLILGFANGVFWSIGASTAVRLVPEKDQTRATAIVVGGISVASVLGVPLGTFIGEVAGWRMAFVAVGLLGIAALLALMSLLPAMPAREVLNLSELPRLLRNRSLLTAVLVTAVFVIGHFEAFTYVRPYLAREASVSTYAISGVLLAYGIAGVIGTVIAGVTASRSLRGTFVIAAIPLVIALSILGTGQGSIVATMMVLVWGITYAIVPVCLQSWVMTSVKQAESATSAYVLAFNLSIALGSLIGGLITDNLGPAAVMWFGAGCVVLSILLSRLPGRSASTS